ncbi:Arabinanase/levansucrase/invertase [Panus rudis PR-1116 ss-1]|nr:Arabinanase/levansucrase/invertase [Panus rudis PR-1116 ss-1]
MLVSVCSQNLSVPSVIMKVVLVAILAAALGFLPALVLSYSNPILWEDLPDLDIRNVDGVYYYSASSFHYSPGAPILRSHDLVNWEHIGHSVPDIADFGSQYSLTDDQRAYVQGIWASFFDFNPKLNVWIWGGCINFWNTFIYTAPNVTGPWTKHAQLPGGTCYYDSGFLVDDDGTMYISYSNNSDIWVAQLSSDATSQVTAQQVFTHNSDTDTLEGTRMYKRNGFYYILTDHPSTSEWALKSSSPFGPYTGKALVNNAASPLANAGPPHQGGIVEDANGNWHYMAFVDSYPVGRLPVLAPINWGSDGYPVLSLTGNRWETTYPNPLPTVETPSLTGIDTFTSIGPQWQWNHSPDTTKFSVGPGLRLSTATVTDDVYSARNTLTHRTIGPVSVATIKMSISSMLDGDRAGLVLLRDQSAWVGVKRDGGEYSVAMVTDINMGTNWETISTGTTAESVPISAQTVWLRANASVAPSLPHTATFAYSLDGNSYTDIGESFTLNVTWNFFLGYRFGIFNYATTSLGGSVTVSSFDLETSETGDYDTGSSPGTGDGSSGSGSAATVAQYGQCGGIGYTGPTTCASPFTCKVQNDWYSQCL